MNALSRTFLAFCLLLLAFTIFSAAQNQPSPQPQTPRGALIEMVNGGPNSVMKHLTVEVQQLLNQPENRTTKMEISSFPSIRGDLGKDVHFFETGPVLLSFTAPANNDPKQMQKVEVHVDNDSPSGGEETLEFSVHAYQNGEEVQEEWTPFLSHMTVSLVQQEGIWRLNKAGVGIEFRIGDPEFLKATILKNNNKATGVGVVAPGTVLKPGDGPETPEFQPEQLTTMLGYTEMSFARLHPETGFTCSLTELGEFTKASSLDPQITTGAYRGYKIHLTGCQGKPAGSFQLVVEPITGAGGKAFCVDATQNLRISDDGRGATCLLAGRPAKAAAQEDESNSVGVDLVSTPPPKP